MMTGQKVAEVGGQISTPLNPHRRAAEQVVILQAQMKR
jgi:hypothetical protein